jgi:hypothetical protein
MIHRRNVLAHLHHTSATCKEVTDLLYTSANHISPCKKVGLYLEICPKIMKRLFKPNRPSSEPLLLHVVTTQKILNLTGSFPVQRLNEDGARFRDDQERVSCWWDCRRYWYLHWISIRSYQDTATVVSRAVSQRPELLQVMMQGMQLPFAFDPWRVLIPWIPFCRSY